MIKQYEGGAVSSNPGEALEVPRGECGEVGREASMRVVILRFLIAGGLATALQYMTLALCVHMFHTSAALGSGIGYLLGSALNYAINYFFTFSSDQSHAKTAAKFYVMVAIGWALNTGSMALLADTLGWNNWVAQVLTTGLSLVSNFTISKLWVFRKK